MRVAVLGTGAVGGYFGGRLAEAGEEVAFLARGPTLAALRTRGLRLESPEGDLHLTAVHATDRPEEVGPVDLVLVTTKAWQVTEAARAAGPLLGQGTALLPLQNGVEAPEQIAEVVGAERVLVGLCRIISYVTEPGVIRHHGVRPSIHLGERDNARSARVLRVAEALDRAPGMDAKVPSDIQVALWRKFVFIAPVSAVGAVARAPLGVLRTVPETRRLVEEAMEEVCRVARARGVALAPETAAQTAAFLDALPPDGTTSMQRDLIEGRPSELEAQVGAVVRLGDAAGVPTPVHRMLYAALLPLEGRSRGGLTWPEA